MATHQTDWLNLLLAVEELEEGFDEFRLPFSQELDGQKFELYLDDATDRLWLNFNAPGEVTWGDNDSPPRVDTYQALAIRPAILFVNLVFHDDPRQALSLVLDLAAAEAMILRNQLPNREDANPDLLRRLQRTGDFSAVQVHVSHAGINGARQARVHHRTRELIGQRLLHTYSSEHAFEHIYLNDLFFSWQSLAGPDKGMCDTDPCDYFKIADRLYLFYWRERIVPWVGMVLIDLAQNRTAGKVFYSDLTNPDKITHQLVGARVTFLSETHYPDMSQDE
ncbi:MAG: MoaF N-terminal domain-containing protein [Anaerolineae bacterium]|nr:MoaF N-terminal domain-containing protein [Anaerolineae bacterium]